MEKDVEQDRNTNWRHISWDNDGDSPLQVVGNMPEEKVCNSCEEEMEDKMGNDMRILFTEDETSARDQ